MNRRHVLQVLAASALPGCDRLVLEVENTGIQVGPDGRPFIDPISSNEDFYIYQCCGTPTLTDSSWRLDIFDRGELRTTLVHDDLLALSPVEVELTLQCIGSSPRSPLINNAIWGGMPLAQVLEERGVAVDPSIAHLRLVGHDAYDAQVPASDLDVPIWLVWQMNGVPLPFEHGGPARLMVPGRYGVKNVKWIHEIELLDAAYDDYWTTRGWDPDAVYKANGFILVPTFNETVTGPVYVLGTAFAGSDPIVKVEVTSDEGASWSEAMIEYANGPNVWALWSWEWDPKPDSYLIQVRVTTESGKVSALEAGDPLAGFDGGSVVPVTVT